MRKRLSPSIASTDVELRPLSFLHRFLAYGMHGFFDEIVFTALYQLVIESFDPRFIGYTSLFSFIIYGTGSSIIESLFLRLQARHVPCVIRIFLYVLVAFIIEFSFGLILRQFDACSWDYSDRPLNFMGLITLTYAPGWALLGYWQEIFSSFLLSLRRPMKSKPS
ncbi:transmembrane protein 229B-like [Anneissia japonica]|uniref:transmembrane protein 229B-like n=1 Tax=Anneissia japonica TaxID=1529436 RepID=UPI0014258267|nr:transmembrane protein 229B-like [Anneissia japonica]